MQISDQIHEPTALSQGNETPKPTDKEAGRAPEPVFTIWKREKKALALAWNRNRNPQLSTPPTELSRPLGLK
jgi:hypothetical protein